MFAELHRSFKNHPKVRVLARALGVPRPYARGLVVGLWLEALDECPCTGAFKECTAEDVAWKAEWTEPTGAKVFCNALVEAGLLDEIEGGYQIHDWEDHTAYIRKAIRDRERKRRKRLESAEAESAEIPRTFRGRSVERSRKVALQPEPEPEPEPEPLSLSNRDPATPDAPLGLGELEREGFERFGQLSGGVVAKLRRFAPVARWEWDAVLATEGRSWTYVARVLQGLRKESSRDAPPRAAPKPLTAYERGVQDVREWARREDEAEAERLRRGDGDPAGVLPAPPGA
ncbi:MAG: hypothetical protein GWN29_04810 [Gammaproteobacteria bacterium]|nr:hypothetical protein [Gammaproteobacteria bacterium]NIV51077.1 hypothetical protein [Gammaproteobacteria bacterium]NIW23926.1 hypothetical protein [Gammaproteobacteria bacterium]NIX85019.1 hypothetical protein [Gammaproteobacteria bacterium]